MKAVLKNGFIVNGRLAKIFADRGIATYISDSNEENKVVDTNETKPTKKARRTNAQIEADKNKGV